MTPAARVLGWAGLALVVAVNGWMLASVAMNRAGAPGSTLAMTERELSPPFGWPAAREDSGLALRIVWRIPTRATDGSVATPGYPDFHALPEWIDEATLAELGVDIARLRAIGPARGGMPTEREAYVALEFDGAAYAATLARARARATSERELAQAHPGKPELASRATGAEENARNEERRTSRLFVVAAGSDAATLRARYPDRTRVAIVRAVLRPVRLADGRAGAYLGHLAVGEVLVPLDRRAAFVDPSPAGTVRSPFDPVVRYDVTVAWGSRHEPWIVAAGARP